MANGLGIIRPTRTGKKDGWYYDMPALSWAPRVGLAWDVFGDGKTAIRASGGIFYNFINRSQYRYNGGALVSQHPHGPQLDARRTRRRRPRDGSFVESPQQVNIPAGFATPMHGEPDAAGRARAGKNYQVNLAFQRDIGFNTVAEVAWVANIGRKFWRTKTANNIPSRTRYGEPEQPVRNEPISANFLRRDYPGHRAASAT